MSKDTECGPVFAMDGLERPLVALANSSTRVLAPPVRSTPSTPQTTSSIGGTRTITLGQLAQPKKGGIK